MRLRRRARGAAAGLVALLLIAAESSRGESGVLELVPERTQIRFELDATLHTVEGSLRLLRGELRFDAASGRAEGDLAIDARSAQTGNARRDRTMHADVLESERYPEIRFAATALELVRSAPDRGEAVLSGSVRIHGDEHPLRIPARLERHGDAIRIAAVFRVPYVAWGLRDVSNLLLRVAPEVVVHVDATAIYRPAASEARSEAKPSEVGHWPPRLAEPASARAWNASHSGSAPSAARTP